MKKTSASPREANYGGPERRRDPRARAEIPITIGAKDRRLEARVKDVSRSGVCFLSPAPFSEMSVLRVELELPGNPKKTVRADGAVVRSAKSGDAHEVAVFFTAIGEDDRLALADFVAGRLASR